jgi:hypothetical protein
MRGSAGRATLIRTLTLRPWLVVTETIRPIAVTCKRRDTTLTVSIVSAADNADAADDVSDSRTVTEYAVNEADPLGRDAIGESAQRVGPRQSDPSFTQSQRAMLGRKVFAPPASRRARH